MAKGQGQVHWLDDILRNLVTFSYSSSKNASQKDRYDLRTYYLALPLGLNDLVAGNSFWDELTQYFGLGSRRSNYLKK